MAPKTNFLKVFICIAPDHLNLRLNGDVKIFLYLGAKGANSAPSIFSLSISIGYKKGLLSALFKFSQTVKKTDKHRGYPSPRS
jgi:hypothetical protein